MKFQFRNNLEDRVLNSCFADNDGFSEPGGMGGGGHDPVAETPNLGGGNDGVGGANPQEMQYDFGEPGEPSQGHVEHVSRLFTQEAVDPQRPITQNDIMALLRFDAPLGKKKPEAQPKQPPAQQQQPGQPPAQAQQQPQPGQQQPGQQQPQPVPAPPQSFATELVSALKEAGFTIGGQQQQNQDPQAPKQRQFYGEVRQPISIDQGLVQALVGTDDPEVLASSGQAVSVLINGLANHIINDVGQLLMANQRYVMEQIPQIAQQHTTQATAQQAFFGRHPELNKPAFIGAVNQVSKALREHNDKNNIPYDIGSEAYQTQLGNLVHKYLENQFGFAIPRGAAQLQQPGQQPIVAPHPPQQQQTPQRRPFVTPQSSAPAGRQNGAFNGHQSADLMDMVF